MFLSVRSAVAIRSITPHGSHTLPRKYRAQWRRGEAQSFLFLLRSSSLVSSAIPNLTFPCQLSMLGLVFCRKVGTKGFFGPLFSMCVCVRACARACVRAWQCESDRRPWRNGPRRRPLLPHDRAESRPQVPHHPPLPAFRAPCLTGSVVPGLRARCPWRGGACRGARPCRDVEAAARPVERTGLRLLKRGVLLSFAQPDHFRPCV